MSRYEVLQQRYDTQFFHMFAEYKLMATVDLQKYSFKKKTE